MYKTVQVVSAGESLGICLSDDLLESLGAALGDTLTVTEIPSGFALKKFSQEVLREDVDVLKFVTD